MPEPPDQRKTVGAEGSAARTDLRSRLGTSTWRGDSLVSEGSTGRGFLRAMSLAFCRHCRLRHQKRWLSLVWG